MAGAARTVHLPPQGEKQCLAFARVLIHRPGVLVLDEATSALHVAGQADLMQLLGTRLPGVTLISIGHRPELESFHERKLTMQSAPAGTNRTSRSGHTSRRMKVVSPQLLAWIARAGFIGRGVVFLILGGAALSVALSGHGHPLGAAGAVNAILRQPLGNALALVIAVGLLCFAALRLTEAIDDVHGYGGDWRGLAQRASLAIAGFFYIGLGILGASIVLTGGYARNEDAEIRDWTEWALSMPAGEWLVGIAGAIVAGVGIGLAVNGFRQRFAMRLKTSEEGSGFAVVLGTIGFLARSLVFVLIGCFLIFAAWRADAREAAGFGGALLALRSERYGNALLLAAAAGLLAFGLFGVSEARFGRAANPSAPVRRRR